MKIFKVCEKCKHTIITCMQPYASVRYGYDVVYFHMKCYEDFAVQTLENIKQNLIEKM
jgi:hypothetical protein